MKSLTNCKLKTCVIVLLPALMVLFVSPSCSRDKNGKLIVKKNLFKNNIFKKKKDKPRKKIVMTPEISGTVAEVALLVSGGDAPITGTGIVVGLDKNGSSEVPPGVKRKLITYLANEMKIGRSSYNLQQVTPAAFLNDHDTAVVRVDAIIPSGAPRGTLIDVAVSAWPRTQTTSLEGGVLLPTKMHWEIGRISENKYLKSLGRSEGTIFVNPFLDSTKSSGTSRPEGVVLNGAEVVKDMPIRLELRRPNYHTSKVLQRRINERFSVPGRKVATAKNRYNIEVKIPPEYRKNYRYFLQLLMHLPRSSGPSAYEAHAKRIARAMTRPNANYDGLALVWEAMGKSILSTVQKVYSSSDPAASFFAARAGLRLNDTFLAGPIVLATAQKNGAPQQLLAIQELGYHSKVIKAGQVLRELLNNTNELVRIHAYESLLRRGDRTAVTRYNVDGEFLVDIVKSTGKPVVYATRSGKPKIVLFGNDVPIANPVFYSTPDGNVTIFSKKGDPNAENPLQQRDHAVVYRKLPRSERTSEKFNIDFSVWPLIRVLGSPPRPSQKTWKIQGIGLTYSQVVGILCRMCKENLIEAKFVLQQPTELQRIYRYTPSVGRPDRPDR